MSGPISRISPDVYIKGPNYGSNLHEILKIKQSTETEEIVKYMEEHLHKNFVGTAITKKSIERIKSNIYGLAQQYTKSGFPIEVEDLELKNDTLTFKLQIPPFHQTDLVYDFTVETIHNEVKITRRNLTRPNAPWRITDKP